MGVQQEGRYAHQKLWISREKPRVTPRIFEVLKEGIYAYGLTVDNVRKRPYHGLFEYLIVMRLVSR